MVAKEDFFTDVVLRLDEILKQKRDEERVDMDMTRGDSTRSSRDVKKLSTVVVE